MGLGRLWCQMKQGPENLGTILCLEEQRGKLAKGGQGQGHSHGSGCLAEVQAGLRPEGRRVGWSGAQVWLWEDMRAGPLLHVPTQRASASHSRPVGVEDAEPRQQRWPVHTPP